MKTDLTALSKMPAHESTAEMRKRIEEETTEAAQKKPVDPRIEEEYVFDFKWKDARGKSWSGRFKNRILSIAQQQLVGALQSDMAGGKPYHSLDPMTAEINLLCAWMAVSLDEEERPLWAKDFRSFKNVLLLQAIYKEVASHEATFHGLVAGQGTGQEDDL